LFIFASLFYRLGFHRLVPFVAREGDFLLYLQYKHFVRSESKHFIKPTLKLADTRSKRRFIFFMQTKIEFKNEIWKEVENFEGRYEISNFGRIKSIGGKFLKETILKTCIDSVGYFKTTLRKKPLKKHQRIHVLVAEHFLIKPDIKNVCVNHKDGNKLNNHVDNLEWTDLKNNCLHALQTGLFNLKGENHPHSKLTNEAVYHIKFNSKNLTNTEIANLFSMSRRQIRDIRKGVHWKHITKDYKPNLSIS